MMRHPHLRRHFSWYMSGTFSNQTACSHLEEFCEYFLVESTHDELLKSRKVLIKFALSVSSRVPSSTIQIRYNIPYKLSRVDLKYRIVQIIIYLYFLITVSDYDLKPSVTFFRTFACGLGFAGYVFLGFLPLEGDFGHGALRSSFFRYFS